MMEKMKTTAPVSSVGADGVQPNVKNHNEIIANSQEQINQQATKNPEIKLSKVNSIVRLCVGFYSCMSGV